MKTLIVTSILFALSLPGPRSRALTWGESGHRITAEIAERNLDKKTRAVD